MSQPTYVWIGIHKQSGRGYAYCCPLAHLGRLGNILGHHMDDPNNPMTLDTARGIMKEARTRKFLAALDLQIGESTP